MNNEDDKDILLMNLDLDDDNSLKDWFKSNNINILDQHN